MNGFELELGYKWMLLGLSMKDSPISKKNLGIVELSDLETFSIRVGAKKKWSLPVIKKTSVELKAILDYPLSGSSSNSTVDISKVEGYSFDTKLTLSKQIINNSNYALSVVWPLEFNYNDKTSSITWGTNSGETSSKYWGVGSQIGLEVNF